MRFDVTRESVEGSTCSVGRRLIKSNGLHRREKACLLMFPSSGLFADINCPFSKRGLCERPHCLYKHATEYQDMFGASFIPSIVDSAGQCLEVC